MNATTVATALERLRSAGLLVSLVDGRLSVEPKERLTKRMDGWLKVHLADVKAYLQEAEKASTYVASRPVRSGRKSFSMVDNLIRDEVLGNIRMVDFGVLMFFVFEFERYHDRPIAHYDITAHELMGRLGLGRNTVLDALDRLVDTHKLLEREDQRDKNGHRISTRYRLRLDAFDAQDPQVRNLNLGPCPGPKPKPRGVAPGLETIPGRVEKGT